MKPTLLLILVTVVAVVSAFVGCATAPPTELVNARSAYQQASVGPAAQLAPAELHKADEALAVAEQSFKQDSDSYKTRDLAYVAQRKSQLADVLGVMAADEARKASADADFQRNQGEMVERGKKALSASEKQTADAMAEQEETKRELRDAETQAAEAEQRTVDAEQRMADVIAEISKLAPVKDEPERIVVTLSGSVLFRSGESTLLPSAQAELDQVASSLLSVQERNIVIAGHADSQGSDSYNQSLSQRRAEAVRGYLVQRGYPGDRIQARGMGETIPIADNASPEGRANNRRVEIVIEHKPRPATP